MPKQANKNDSMKMLSTALKMEEKGKAFYAKAVSTCTNEMGKEIFTFLMNEEVVHVDRIRKIYGTLKDGKGWSDEWKKISTKPGDLHDFFHDLAVKNGKKIKAQTSDLDALDIGIDFEKKAVEFYSRELSGVKDKFAKDFIEMMVLEEKRHAGILEEMKLYTTDPEGWGSKFDTLSYDGG